MLAAPLLHCRHCKKVATFWERGANQHYKMWNTHKVWDKFLENILTYHKTKFHYHNTFTTPKINVHFRKHIKTRNTFTSIKTNLSSETNLKIQFPQKWHPKFGFGPEVISGAGQFELLIVYIDRDGKPPSHFLPFFVANTSRLTRFCFSCGRSIEVLNGPTEEQGTYQKSDNSLKKKKLSAMLR